MQHIPRRASTYLACITLSLTFVGCASVRQDKFKTFADGVSVAKTQADDAFVAVNTLTSQAVIDYAAKQPTLDDKHFFDVLDADSIARWDAILSAMQKYCQSLLLLTGSDITKNYRDATSELASQISETGQKLKTQGLISDAPQLSAGLATAFAELGNILLEAKANADAENTIRRADPTVQRIFKKMADVIGANGKEGIRGTVYAHWELIKASEKVDFLEAHELPAKRAVASQFSDAKSKQQAQDTALASLRKSFRALSDAHHALALDSKVQVAAAITVVKQEAKNTKEIYDKMQTATKPQ